MVTSNSGIDFISLARASGVDPESIMKEPEFASWLREYLSENTITVTFTKKDGTDREMHCTLSESRIPTDKQPKTKEEPSTSSGSALRVFDTDKQEWRSFRWDAIKEVRFEL